MTETEEAAQWSQLDEKHVQMIADKPEEDRPKHRRAHQAVVLIARGLFLQNRMFREADCGDEISPEDAYEVARDILRISAYLGLANLQDMCKGVCLQVDASDVAEAVNEAFATSPEETRS